MRMASNRYVMMTGVVALPTIVAVLLASVASAQSPPPVSVATPLAKRITVWDEYAGRFEAQETVEVRPRVSGFIEKIHFRDGQLVKAGDLLFSLEKQAFLITVEGARAEVARATAQVQLGENEVNRAAPLAQSGIVTRRDLDQRGSSLAVAQAQQQAARATLKAAELNLQWTEVRAAIPGRISDRKVDAGNLVNGGAAATTALATIVAVDPIHFRFDISEADYMRYTRQFIAGDRKSGREVAHPVRIKLADDKDWSRTGQLDFVDNQLNSKSGTLRGRAVFNNTDQLFTPGLFARMQLYGGELDALLIPDSSIGSDQARKIVFTVGTDSLVKAQTVQLGELHEGLRIVRSGLSAEDRVVIDGLANPMVRPGSKVTPQATQIKSVAN